MKTEASGTVFSPQMGERVVALRRSYDEQGRPKEIVGWDYAVVKKLPEDEQTRYGVEFTDCTFQHCSYFELRPLGDKVVQHEEEGVEISWDSAQHETQPAKPSTLRDVRRETIVDGPPLGAQLVEAAKKYDETLAQRFKAAAALLLEGIAGDDVIDEDTPGRFIRALRDLTSGYGVDTSDLMKLFDAPEGPAPGLVVVRDIPFASLCEHHVLPFTGTATVGYLPDNKIIGLSKIPRIVRALSRRLQTQERLCREIASALGTRSQLAARGVIVVLKARHTCMAIRGAESPGEMMTSSLDGIFFDDVAARAEALAIMGLK